MPFSEHDIAEMRKLVRRQAKPNTIAWAIFNILEHYMSALTAPLDTSVANLNTAVANLVSVLPAGSMVLAPSDATDIGTAATAIQSAATAVQNLANQLGFTPPPSTVVAGAGPDTVPAT